MAESPFIERLSMMRMPHFKFHVALAIVIALSSLLWQPGHSQAAAPEEYQVKAAFLYHFATFVDWPPSVFRETNGSFRVCIIGKDPFGRSLDTALQAKKIHEHALEIHRNPPKTELRHCHLLYIAASRSAQLNTLSKQYGNANVLTVGENETFLKHGGMIKFFMDDQKVRFAINPDAISATNLKVSSKLLRLAEIMTP